MSTAKTNRESASPFIQRVAVRQYLDNEGDVTLPDGARDIVVMKIQGRTHMMLTGNITQPIPLHFPPGSEVMNIMLAPGAHFTATALAAPKMVNESIALQPTGKNSVWMGSYALEIPSFDTAESFVDTLAKNGLIQIDELVMRLVDGNPMASSERTTQRRFLQATGLTYKYFTQIGRAWKAASLLQTGMPARDVAFALGYTDQPHMIKSLKAILGQTPTNLKNSPLD